MLEGLTGILLAGGQSRRFGSDKAFSDWKGRSLLETAVLNLAPVTREVLVCVKSPARYAHLLRPGVRVVSDQGSSPIPLEGLRTGLREMKTEFALTRACDMPFLRAEVLSLLWSARLNRQAVIPIWEGEAQPLCGLYSSSCLPEIESALAEGRGGIVSLLDSLRTEFIDERALRSIDPNGLSFLDIDTIEDRSRALALC